MDTFLLILKTAAACAAMIAIVPLMVWGGSGSWRHALYALKQYLGIMGALVAIVGGLALWAVLMERIGG